MGNLNTMAILSLVFAFIFFPLGLIFGIVAIKQINKNNEDGKKLAVAAIIISLIPIAVLLLLFLSGFVIGFFSEILKIA